jgi:hypothetical protein
MYSSANFDAFGCLRVSEKQNLFESKLTLDTAALLWDEAETSGSGTSTSHSTTNASVTMTVATNTAGTRVRQTKRKFAYQAGNSQLVEMTFVLGAAATGITRRVGYFDASNGLFLEQSAGTLYFCIRKNGSDTKIPQSQWNGENLLGADVSTITIDPSKAQIFWFDFEWLGVGTVRFGFVLNGQRYVCHSANHANSVTSVYMSTPTLPLRYEISNDGTGAQSTLQCICNRVASEGGSLQFGQFFSTSRGATGLTTLNDSDAYPLIALRLQSTKQNTAVVLNNLTLVVTSTAAYRWALVLNPTITGTALSWSAVTNSAMEVDVARTNGSKVTGGVTLIGGYGLSNNEGNVASSVGFPGMGATIAGVSDIVVLAVQRLTGTTETFYGSIDWREA